VWTVILCGGAAQFNPFCSASIIYFVDEESRQKRKTSSGAHNSSPAKRQDISNSPNKGKNAKYRATTPHSQQNPSGAATSSSSHKTPKTPRGASKHGICKDTAKCLMKHGSKFGALYDMLLGFARIILSKKPETEEEFKPLLDQLAAQLVNALCLSVSVSLICLFSGFCIIGEKDVFKNS
jgi:hypothetical protein